MTKTSIKRALCGLATTAAGLALLSGCDVARSPSDSNLGQDREAASTNGVAGSMMVYYDAEFFTVNFKEEPTKAEAAQIAHNGSINTIYEYDPGLPGGVMFVPVLDAIQGDGFNPLWQETQLVFAAGVTPHQFFSDTDIADAVKSGEITLSPTDEVYRCSVIGKPEKP